MIINPVFTILVLALAYLLSVYGLLWLAKFTEHRSRPQG